MKKRYLTVAALLFCVVAAHAQGPPAEHPDTSGPGWEDLFAPDLSNALFPEGVWTVEDGLLTASEDEVIWTSKVFDDFVLDLEFRNAPGTNSGVFIYGSDVVDFIPNSVEIQIADDYAEQWAKAPATWQAGAFFGHKPAAKRVVAQPGEWNRYTITARDNRVWVLLNGTLVNEIDLNDWTSATTNPDGTEIPEWLSRAWSTLPTHGHIGLQGKHAGAPIYFRNLRVKELE